MYTCDSFDSIWLQALLPDVLVEKWWRIVVHQRLSSFHKKTISSNYEGNIFKSMESTLQGTAYHRIWYFWDGLILRTWPYTAKIEFSDRHKTKTKKKEKNSSFSKFDKLQKTEYVVFKTKVEWNLINISCVQYSGAKQIWEKRELQQKKVRKWMTPNLRFSMKYSHFLY